MLQAYPVPQSDKQDAAAEEEMRWLMQFILGVRRIRGEMNIPPGKMLPVLIQNGSDRDSLFLENNHFLITKLGRIDDIQWLDDSANAPESAISLIDSMKILIPMAGLIDKQAESIRLNKELDKLEKELHKSEAKLNNTKFLERAPTQVVAKEKDRQTSMKLSMKSLKEQLEKISAL